MAPSADTKPLAETDKDCNCKEESTCDSLPLHRSWEGLPLQVVHPSQHPCTVPLDECPIDDQGQPVRVNGLRYYRNFFSPAEQKVLLDFLYQHPWQKLIARRQQFYGECYYHTSYQDPKLQPNLQDTNGSKNDDRVKEVVATPSLEISALRNLLQRCESFFGDQGFPSQILVNEYRNNLGISSHFEDFDAFGDIILTISLTNPLYMTLKKPLLRNNSCEDYHEIRKILLEPGSLLIMEDEARFDYRHGISKYKWIRGLPNGQPDILRDEAYRRVSITLRHLKSTRRQVSDEHDESSGWRYQFGVPGGKTIISSTEASSDTVTS